VEELTEFLVEPPKAAEAGRESHFGHGHCCFVDELFSEEDASGLRHGDRRCAEMLNKQSPKVTFTYAQTFCERFDAGFVSVQRTVVNQRKRTRDCVRSSPPGSQVGRRFRTTAEAGTKTRFLRRRC
jgi:hypothetical protein